MATPHFLIALLILWLSSFSPRVNYCHPFTRIHRVSNYLIAAGLFTLAGFYQMAVWAKGKHRQYKKEFKDYPRRKAILPFLMWTPLLNISSQTDQGKQCFDFNPVIFLLFRVNLDFKVIFTLCEVAGTLTRWWTTLILIVVSFSRWNLKCFSF